MKASNYLIHYHNGAMAAAGLIVLIEGGLNWREKDKFGMTLEESLSMSKSMNNKQIDEVASIIYTLKDMDEKLRVCRHFWRIDCTSAAVRYSCWQ